MDDANSIGCVENYTPPRVLGGIPLKELDVLDPRFTLDQIAEKVSNDAMAEFISFAVTRPTGGEEEKIPWWRP